MASGKREMREIGVSTAHCGFLFNHDQLHQVAHCAPIAFELMRLGGVQVSLLVTTAAQFHYLHRALVQCGLSTDHLHLVQLPDVLRALAPAFDAVVPFSRVMNLLVNRGRFRPLDVLVAPEKTSLILRSMAGLKSLQFVHTRHGAGDRAVGFDRQSGNFDLVLMSGAKIRDRLQDAGLLHEGGYAIVGYPKFDACVSGERRGSLFPNNRPTVLYNPHCSPRLSSWYRYGLDVLEAFHRSGKYNLIFAPHVMLFRKRVQFSLKPLRMDWPGGIPERFLQSPHMLIDLGSERSVDMTYTEGADCYLGDVSSQIYEFLRKPRPCAFIDAHQTPWRDDDNYRHWSSGPVLSSAEDLLSKIEAAFATHAAYRQVQRALFDYSIDVSDMPGSQRAAQAIHRFVHDRFTLQQSTDPLHRAGQVVVDPSAVGPGRIANVP